MAHLNARLDAAAPQGASDAESLVAWARTYAAFAAANRNRWRALFEHRLAPGRALPDWFRARSDAALRTAGSRHGGARSEARRHDPTPCAPRTLFSAVHGIVALGLEEKLVAMPVEAVEAELETFVRAYVAGMASDLIKTSP